MTHYQDNDFHGLSLVAEMDISGPTFDVTAVFKHNENGTLWWGTDSGCSCPAPFEGITGTNDLRPLRTDSDYVTLTRHLLTVTGPTDQPLYSVKGVVWMLGLVKEARAAYTEQFSPLCETCQWQHEPEDECDLIDVERPDFQGWER